MFRKLESNKYVKKILPWLFLSPYLIAFTLFIVIPVGLAILLSFTRFDLVSPPEFVGFQNYINIFTSDNLFYSKIIPNTLIFAFFVGFGGYFLSFILAWMLAQIPSKPRKILAIIIYMPSMVAGITIAVIWKIIFSGDASGYLNAWLLGNQYISQPIQFLTDPKYIMFVMIIVSLWSSMGIGFLAMLSGILGINPELYEAAYMDGIKNRYQEITQITIPAMKPQMLFGAIMALVSAFNAGMIGVQLSGVNPTPQYAGQLLGNHIDDYALQRYEMGYAAALSVILLIVVYVISKIAFKVFSEK
ncbi:MAG: carbohydrate ABC transporter permease [Mycoplasmatales bacterium]